MDKTEFHRISAVIEDCIKEMPPARVDSMLRVFEELAQSYALRGGGAIIVQLGEDGVRIYSICLDEAHAAELLGAIAIRMHNDLMEDAPPREMFN